MSSGRKYIIDGTGKLVLNKDYQLAAGGAQLTTAPVTANTSTLAVATTVADQIAMQQATALPIPQPLQDAINMMQNPDYVASFKSTDLSGDALLDGLLQIFSRNEIPIGLMSKLTPLQGNAIHFKIDNSGSMKGASNLLIRDACAYTKKTRNPKAEERLSRWEEAEDRLHTLIELFAHVPTGPITLSFFDYPRAGAGKRIVLERQGRSPDDCLQAWHEQIRKLFAGAYPDASTPILYNMQNMLREADKMRQNSDIRTMHYLLTDGEPDGKEDEIDEIKSFLKGEVDGSSLVRDPKLNPFTFLGCSNRPEDYQWMHEIEEIAKYVAAISDFRDERDEVRKDQGVTFPYTRGFWLLCNVAAAVNLDDLDALDQHAPLTKTTLESLLGRGLMEPEYRQYFIQHPTFTDRSVPVFEPDYQAFLTVDVARNIPTVAFFNAELAKRLAADMDKRMDNTEARREREVEDLVISSRKRQAPIVATSQYSGSMFPAQRSVLDTGNKNDICSSRDSGPRQKTNDCNII